MIPYKYRNIYYTIRDFLFPRQKWLTKEIPNSWCDKTELIWTVLRPFIINFIEEERALEVVDWDYLPDQKEFSKNLQKYYLIIKTEIPNLEKELEKEWENISLDTNLDNLNKMTKKDYKEKYRKIDKLEEKIEKLKTEVMIFIISYRQYFWT